MEDLRDFQAASIDFNSKTVLLEVGKDAEQFVVHEKLLRQPTSFFDLALKQERKKGTPAVIQLSDDTPEVVDLYIQWLYRGRVFCRPSLTTSGEDSDELELFVDAFVFGEKIQDGDFKDAIIDALICCSVQHGDSNGKCWYPSDPAIDRAYEGTQPDSPIRRLILDMHCEADDASLIASTENPDFLRDLATALFERSSGNEQDLIEDLVDGCTCHQHGRDEKCYVQKQRTRSRPE